MKQLALVAITALLLAGAGCSVSSVSPVLPGEPVSACSFSKDVQTHLWGFYDVYVDVQAKTATAVLNRGAMFAANVTNFINAKASNLSLKIIDTPMGSGFVDVDVDVSLTHPFPGLNEYDGYDVRGIFIANGSKTLKYNPDLIYAAHKGLDQEMYDYGLTSGDIHAGPVGMPDGYTRWWNPTEFKTPGLFGYTPGKFATPGYSATATLNPYKYFADTLSVDEPLWDFLTSEPAGDLKPGVFRAGSTNTRNYYLRFPSPSPGVKFAYAVLANWKGTAPEDHPANAPEACGISVSVTPDLYYVNAGDWGGKLVLDMSFPTTWGELPSTVFIESTVLSSPYQLTPAEMVPSAGGTNFSTYHAEVTADDIKGSSATMDHEFWVIAQYDSYDYTNPLAPPNDAGTDKLAAFFRYDLYVASEPSNQPPVCDLKVVTPMPYKYGKGYISFDASGSWDPNPGDTLTFSWDFNGDGTFGDPYDWGTASKPIKNYNSDYIGKVWVRVTDSKGKSSECSVDVNIDVLREINVEGTPNISIGSITPRDIFCDPASDTVGISLNNSNQFRKYTNNYSSYTTVSLSWGRSSMLDAASYGLLRGNDNWTSYYYGFTVDNWNGQTWGGFSYYTTTDNFIDAGNSPQANEILGFYDTPSYGRISLVLSAGFGQPQVLINWYAPFYNGSGSTGVVLANVKAIDVPFYSGSNKEFYTLEKIPAANTGVIERWENTISTWPVPTFKGAFGEGFLYDPLDISVDSEGNVYVLEKISSGAGILWAYNSSGTLIGTSDPFTAAEVSGTPLRCDVYQYSNPDQIHVLHSAGVTRFALQPY